MVESIKGVKNPLTIIAIFAGLAEIAGTVVLPNIDAKNQSTYIWFLMSFPFYLVTVFFATLNWNPKVLYAPSDFRDEKNYMQLFGASTKTLKEEKLNSELKEMELQPEMNELDELSDANADVSQDAIVNVTGVEVKAQVGDVSVTVEPTKSTQSNDIAFKYDSSILYRLAEEYVLTLLSKEFKTFANRDMVLTYGSSKYMFDAVFETEKGLKVVEVKVYKNLVPARFLRRTLEKMEGALNTLPQNVLKDTQVILVIVHAFDNNIKVKFKKQLENTLLDFPFKYETRMYSLDEILTI